MELKIKHYSSRVITPAGDYTIHILPEVFLNESLELEQEEPTIKPNVWYKTTTANYKINGSHIALMTDLDVLFVEELNYNVEDKIDYYSVVSDNQEVMRVKK